MEADTLTGTWSAIACVLCHSVSMEGRCGRICVDYNA